MLSTKTRRFRAHTRDVFFPLYEVWGSPKRAPRNPPPWIRPCHWAPSLKLLVAQHHFLDVPGVRAGMSHVVIRFNPFLTAEKGHF